MLQHNWASLMRTTGGRQWWRGWKCMMPPDLIGYVDSLLDDASLQVKPLNEEVPWLFATEPASQHTEKSV